MKASSSFLSRRGFVFGGGAAGLGLVLAGSRACAQSPVDRAGEVVSVRDFGAVSAPGRDNTAAIQRAVNAVQSRGGGVVLIPEVYECGNIVVSGDGVTFHGPGAWLVNGRITIQNGREGCGIHGLGLIDRRRDDATFLLDIGGHHCTFENVSLVKDPIAGGYQMYLGMAAAHCTFTGLKMRGSNGAWVGGHDHLFDGFELVSTMSTELGGDDAFAIKATGGRTYNITIRNGTVRGYSAIFSIGSEVGTSERNSSNVGSVRNVTVSDVAADRCAAIAFIKPGALSYDWRNGVVEGVRLTNLSIEDRTGFKYATGVMLTAGRGAIIRDVVGRNLTVNARARSQGVLPTSGIDINLIRTGAPARIENVDLQMTVTDPYEGEPNGSRTPGHSIDHIVRIEKLDPRHGTMSNISLDVTGRGSRFGGIYVGAGLDDAVTIRRARLHRVAVNPPASVGGGGIWSDSRINLGDIQVENLHNRRFGGAGLANRN